MGTVETPGGTPALAPVVVPVTNWQDVVRSLGVAGASVAIAWKNPAVAEWALLVLATIASPALARAILDRFRR